MRLPDKMTRRLMALSAVSALAVGAVAFPALADSLSEEPTEGATVEATEEPSSGADPDVRLRFGGRHEAFAEALADELGLPVDQVTAAMEAAQEQLAAQWRDERLAELEDRLDEAVADGELTREQADAIIAALEEGVMPFGPDGMRGHRLGGGPQLEELPDPPMFREPMREAPGSEADGA